MKAWLPVLVEELKAGNSPILALSSIRNLALGAVFSPHGELLGGGLGSPALKAQVSDESSHMNLGECRIMSDGACLMLQRLSGDGPCQSFWLSAWANYEGSWASWLLTMPQINDGLLSLPRHLLSAFGPWTTPRLPQEYADMWSLLPLKPGLGRLFVIGDDGLAMEVAALAARTGLTVTWYSSSKQTGAELSEAQTLADFTITALDGWGQLTADFLTQEGFKDGTYVVLTTAQNEFFIEHLRNLNLRYFALSGEAETPLSPGGLFPKAVTTTHKALGLVAEMLSK
ncbi:MAG: hypothetical protein ACRCTY_10150 [Candidatus Adiutrix sp.]